MFFSILFSKILFPSLMVTLNVIVRDCSWILSELSSNRELRPSAQSFDSSTSLHEISLVVLKTLLWSPMVSFIFDNVYIRKLSGEINLILIIFKQLSCYIDCNDQLTLLQLNRRWHKNLYLNSICILITVYYV